MTICVNARFLTQKITGVQRFARELSRQLKLIRPEIEFISPQNIIHRNSFSELKTAFIGRHQGYWWEQFDLPGHLKKYHQPLLINLANTAPLKYQNKIITIHDLGIFHNPGWYSKRFYYFYRFLIPRIVRNSRKIITVSEFSRQELIKYLDIQSEKIAVINCGLPKAFESITPVDKPNKFGEYILAVSSRDPRKNLESTILAFESLKQKDLKLVIAGASHKSFASSRIGYLSAKNPNIILTGFVTDEELKNLYMKARLFVFTSFYEGFGLPPLEAMACGCPCVISKAASLPEVCEDGVQYCDPYDIEDIADKIRKMLVDENLRQELIIKGQKRAKLFTWENSARKLLAIIDEIDRGGKKSS